MSTMLRNPWPWVVVAFLISACYLSAAAAAPALSAAAAAAAAATATADEQVLVLAVEKGMSKDARLLSELSEHLQRAGLLLAGLSLSEKERSCDSLDCIGDVARRASAQLILTAKLQESAPNTFFITMALFDVVRRAPFQETALCDQCSQDVLSGKLSDIADKLIKKARAARQDLVRPLPELERRRRPTILSTPTLPPAAQGGWLSRLTPRRKILAGVLFGLSAATLATAIALTVVDSQSPSTPCLETNSYRCAKNSVPAYAIGYSLSGALAAGAGIALFWPSGTPASSEVR